MAKYVIDGVTLQDIADSIRTKTGESGSISTLDFATKILSIQGGGGGGSGGISGVVMSTGTVACSNINASTTQTFEHNLGVVPDLVFMWCEATSATSAYVAFMIGFNDDLVSATVYDAPSRTLMAKTATGSLQSLTEPDGIENGSSFGCIKNATETTFKAFGSSFIQVPTDGSYRWVAIGGLTDNMEVV